MFVFARGCRLLPNHVNLGVLCLFSFGLIFFVPIVSLKIFHKSKIFSQSILVIWASAILQHNYVSLICNKIPHDVLGVQISPMCILFGYFNNDNVNSRIKIIYYPKIFFFFFIFYFFYTKIGSLQKGWIKPAMFGRHLSCLFSYIT